jgi:hypothetical protein
LGVRIQHSAAGNGIDYRHMAALNIQETPLTLAKPGCYGTNEGTNWRT